MNDIFVWVGYGEVDVFKAETIEELSNIYQIILSNIKDWDLQEHIDKANTYVNKPDADDLIKRYRTAINYLLKHIEIGSHESFEHGTGFNKLK